MADAPTLEELIRRFHEKYPDDAELTWKNPRRKKTGVMNEMVEHMVTASERVSRG